MSRVTPRGPGRCRSCQAPVTWARHHETGKAAPLERGSDGAFVLSLSTPDDDPVYGTPERLSRARHVPGAIRYRNHYATCPEAGEWRTGARRR